jgi:xanthine dehydrogenase YagS FAD-binding subunit
MSADKAGADANAIADVVLAGARTTPQNAYKLPLVRRTLSAMLSDVRHGVSP